MLSDKFARTINLNREYMLEEIIVSDILPEIKSKSFTEEDVEKVESQIGNKNKVSTLLDLLLEKDDDCFEKFLDILSENSEHVAVELNNSINNKRVRRLSQSEFGNLLIRGGVPDRFDNYIPRKYIEDKILRELKRLDSNKIILVHGLPGCGKSSIVSRVLHSEELFPDRYCKVCWMPIGKIKENEVLSKLITLCSKLDSKIPDPTYIIPDLYKDLIIEKVRKNNILLILDDIWSDNNIMQYFTFPMRYVVTSRNSSLFADRAVPIEIPPKFSEIECKRFLGDLGVTDMTVKDMIKVSYGNPLYLSMTKNLCRKNPDYITRITNKDTRQLVLQQILQSNIDILEPEVGRCYSMFVILDEDETVSLDVLAIYWDIPESQAMGYLNTFFDNNLINRKWIEEYKCNMYGIHDMHNEYLKSTYTTEVKEYQRNFIDRHIRRFQNWLKFPYYDPYFFVHCASILKTLNDENTLETLFTDFTFLAAKIAIAGITEVLFNYEKYRPSTNNESWDEFNNFFLRHHHKFVRLPNVNLNIKIAKIFATMIQLALFENKTSNIFRRALFIKNRLSRDFWIWENAEPSMKIWEACNSVDIDLVDINHSGILTASKSGQLSLFEIGKGKCIFSYKISEEDLILCKFLKTKTLEFLIITEIGNVTFYDLSKLLGQTNELQEGDNNDDNDDMDYVDNGSANNNNDNTNEEIDIYTLRQKLHNISISGTLNESIKTNSHRLKGSGPYVTAFIDYGVLTVARQLDEVSQSFKMKIEYYDLENFVLKSDFNIPFEVKKIVHTKTEDGKYYQFYFLRRDGSSVDLYDDDGREIDRFCYDNKTIYDFILVDRENYMAVEDEIYKSHQPSALFGIFGNAKVVQISVCDDKRLMALCLTNPSIQIWDIVKCVLLYSIKGFDFTKSMFECCNHLISIEKGNVSKWSTDHINHDNNINKPQRHIYRKQFFMHSNNPSLITWIVQKYNNDIEFLSFDNEKYLSEIIHTNSKATCFAVEDNFAFIGFMSSHVRIYALVDKCQKLVLECVNNVNEIFPISTEDNYWNLVIIYNIKMIMIVRISKLDFSYIELFTETWESCSNLKIFKTNSNEVLIGVKFDNKFELYKVNKDFTLTKYFKSDIAVMDFDVNDNGTFICASTANGMLMVWKVDDEDFELCDTNGKPDVLRKCTFRPTLQTKWNVIATVSDNGVVRLFYFYNYDKKVNIIIEDNPPSDFDIFPTMIWTNDGAYLILGETNIKRWKVPKEPNSKVEMKYPLTTLYTFAGGNYCVQVNDTFICTIDRLGYFYILKKVTNNGEN